MYTVSHCPSVFPSIRLSIMFWFLLHILLNNFKNFIIFCINVDIVAVIEKSRSVDQYIPHCISGMNRSSACMMKTCLTVSENQCLYLFFHCLYFSMVYIPSDADKDSFTMHCKESSICGQIRGALWCSLPAALFRTVMGRKVNSWSTSSQHMFMNVTRVLGYYPVTDLWLFNNNVSTSRLNEKIKNNQKTTLHLFSLQ